jgi:hypothetical protein
MLIALAECAAEVRDAVDAGSLALKDAAAMAKHAPEEQARRAARKTAGPSKVKRDCAAPPRPKALARPVAMAMVGAVESGTGSAARRVSYSGHDVARLIRYVLGDREQVNGCEWLLDLATEAETTAKAQKGGAS